jgi:Fe-S oxidoreductase
VTRAEPRESLTPRDKMAAMHLLRIGDAPRTVEHSEPLYGCTGCGACSDFCLHKVEPGVVLFSGRAEAEQDGRGHPALAGFVTRFAVHSRRAASRYRALVAREKRPIAAQVAFFPGCAAPAIAPLMLQLSERIGAAYLGVTEGEHGCAGYPLLAAGQPEAFRAHAQRIAQQWSGYARVVVHCPACAWTLRTQYRAYGVSLAPRSEHTTEFLESFIARLPVRRKLPRAFYHDPCYLGRWLGVYEAPRSLARESVDELREFARTRAQAECSGGGGLLPLTMPRAAEAIAEHRLSEMRQSGVATVVTACATCKRQLTRNGITAVDIVELLAKATAD